MTRRSFVASGLASAASAAGRRPNILYVFADQLRAHSVGCYGNSEVQTPNLDKLASQGLLFRNTFANTPVCCPARANMLTGVYAHRNGMIANDLRLRESETTIAEILGSAGYRTGFLGKWHLDGGPRLPGFIPPGPRRQGFEFWAANECSHSHFDTQYFRDSPEPIPIKKFEAEAWTDVAIDFMRQSRTDARPFFLTVAMGPPHDPYGAPPEYMRRYDAARLTMRPNWKAGAANVPGPKQIAAYYAATTAVDDQVGRMMAALDELGIAQDTIVLFSSDHGDMLGSHGLRLKRKPWEESIRIPGILRYPRGVPGGRATDAILTQVDFAPTLLGLCGVKAPSRMQGSDLSGVAAGKKSAGPDSAFFQIFGPFRGDGTDAAWRGVRTRRHMYARLREKAWVLYDLEADPYQLRNLADDPSAAAVQSDMEGRLKRWMRRTGDSWDNNWSEYVEDNGRLYRDRAFYTVGEYMDWEKAGRPGAKGPALPVR
jgi:arylsulfatase A-like enzyme